MRDQFVTYEIALRLKEKGFAERCLSAYRNSDGEELLMAVGLWESKQDTYDGFCLAPLWQQAIDWLIQEGFISIINILADHNKHESHGIIPFYHVTLTGGRKSGIGDSSESLNDAMSKAILKILI